MRHKILMLIVLALVPARGVPAETASPKGEAVNVVFIGTNLLSHEVYLDLDTVAETKAGTVKVWEYGICTVETEGTKDCHEQGAMALNEFDCRDRLVRVRTQKPGPKYGGLSTYSHNLGDAAKWQDIEPGTIRAHELQAVCDYIQTRR